ncbi:MAG: NAD(P)H-dependent oxidoreductase [Oscillospiraceae bacterium]|nr:NAD(P)H-dependent oxidoreductase [Oscillospiraceae bacterium]
MSKALVAYFSASGVTAKAAEELAAAEGADLFEIRPKVPYSKADLNWRDKKSRSTLEMSDPECRPNMVGTVEDMAQYDVIFLGFPIWWGREPSVVDTFLDAYDFTGKRMILFCTSGGSGFGKTAERIRGLAKGAAVEEGKRLGGLFSESSMKKWLEGLDI